jgi:hypothetical protein
MRPQDNKLAGGFNMLIEKDKDKEDWDAVVEEEYLDYAYDEEDEWNIKSVSFNVSEIDEKEEFNLYILVGTKKSNFVKLFKVPYTISMKTKDFF